MKKLVPLLAVLAIAGVVTAIALGSSGSSTTATTASGATLKLRSGALGKFLVNSRGRTLYEFEKDSSRRSACSGACASNWPPLIVTGKPSVGSGLSARKAGTIRRSNGKLQATYGGHPLYRYVGDSKAGDTNGQDISAFGAKWYVVGANGRKIDPDDARAETQPSDDQPSGSMYGY